MVSLDSKDAYFNNPIFIIANTYDSFGKTSVMNLPEFTMPNQQKWPKKL